MASDKMLGSFDQKSAPEDNDLLVEYDAAASKVKNVKFGGVWNWIVKKLTSAVINELQTSSKNVVGAINELNSKTYSEIYNLKSQNHIIGNASVRSNEVLLNLYYFGDEITKDQTIAILNEHIRPSTERQLYCFAETKNHIWDRIGFIIEPSGIIKHTSGTPRVSIIVNDSYLK